MMKKVLVFRGYDGLDELRGHIVIFDVFPVGLVEKDTNNIYSVVKIDGTFGENKITNQRSNDQAEKIKRLQ